jgi:hypothetical protein
MASNRLFRITVLLGCGIGICAGDDTPTQRVNLARLSIATVSSTQSQPDDPVCDVRKLFDDATESFCTVAANSVEVRFTSPVVVSQVRVSVAPAAAVAPRSSYPNLRFTVSLTASGSRETFSSPMIEVSGARISYTVPRPVTVGHATIRFWMAGRAADIQEIEILGEPPEGTSLAPVTPAVVSKLGL